MKLVNPQDVTFCLLVFSKTYVFVSKRRLCCSFCTGMKKGGKAASGRSRRVRKGRPKRSILCLLRTNQTLQVDQTGISPCAFCVTAENTPMPMKASPHCLQPKRLRGQISPSHHKKGSPICTARAATFEPLAGCCVAIVLTLESAQQGFRYAWGAVLGTWQRRFFLHQHERGLMICWGERRFMHP